MMNPVPWLQMTNMISYQGLVRTFPNLNIELCAVSAIDVLKPAIFVFLGIITVAGWYFTEL
ncbi:hypothetical protein ACWJRK_29195, partial [Klebsiella pneumoniae]